MNKTQSVGYRRHTDLRGLLGKLAERLITFVKKNPVLCIAATLAAVTSLIVTPDAEYLGYFDYRTLTCLFCTLAVICALKGINFF